MCLSLNHLKPPKTGPWDHQFSSTINFYFQMQLSQVLLVANRLTQVTSNLTPPEIQQPRLKLISGITE